MTQDRTVSPVEDPVAEDGPDPGRRLAWTPVIGLVAAVLAWFRVPGSIRDNLYAEDGVVFVGSWAWHGPPELLWQPYGGYQHLLPRLVSWLVVTVFPVASWGYAVTALACLCAGLAAAAVYAFSAGLVAFWPARLVLALVVVLIPVAGVEPVGNLANLHWFMLMLMPWALLARPRTGRGVAVIALVTLVATLTEPTCAIFAPLAVWRFVTARRSRPIAAAWAVGVAAQVLTTLLAPRPRTPGQPPWESVALGYVRDVGMSMVTPDARRLGLAITDVGWWPGFVWVAAILALAAVGAWFAVRDVRVLLAALILGSVASWSAAFITNNAIQYYFGSISAADLLVLPVSRWATAASAMLASTVPVAISVLVVRAPRLRIAGGVLLALMTALLLVNLPARAMPTYDSWSSQVDRSRSSCAATGQIQIHAVPEAWVFSVPCPSGG